MLTTTEDYDVTPLNDNLLVVIGKDVSFIPDIIKDISSNDTNSYIITDAILSDCLIHSAGSNKHFVLAKSIIPAVMETDEYITDKLTRMNISTIRKANHITQKDLAEVSGLSAQCISNIESMDSVQSPTLRSLIKYTNALGYEITFTKIKEN